VGVALMRNPLQILAWLLVLAAAAAVWFRPQALVEPGDLMPAHRSLAVDCLACHEPLRGVPDARCTGCHALADIGLVTTRGDTIRERGTAVAFHQGLAHPQCTACHSDHRGVQAYRPVQTFRHGLLAGDVVNLCAGCHVRPQDGFHASLGDDCAACHDTGDWRRARFDHARWFRFDRHHPATCATCHPAGAAAGYTCYGCHEHSRAGIRAEHLEEGIRDFEDCARCHRSGDEHEAERRMRDGGARRDDD